MSPFQPNYIPLPEGSILPTNILPVQKVISAQPFTSSRLRRQGFTNLYRKPLFFVMAVGILAYLHFVPAPWKVADNALMAVRFIGILLMFAGILGRTLATLTIGGRKDRVIVNTELYSVCRNPLYFSSFLITLGVGLISARGDFLVVIAVSYLAIFYPMMRNEAKFLSANFEGFSNYEKRVPLFFPNFGLWQERKKFEISFPLIKRTVLDASLSLIAIPVILIVGGI